ncbi:hypothetical protein K440DRAFT_641216 [Wilcoxina mikolae CBS 423.85]|nr:hypothetical protein K440DRAFT_641216 [Wilcoxina mikolae CBS 423.85]
MLHTVQGRVRRGRYLARCSCDALPYEHDVVGERQRKIHQRIIDHARLWDLNDRDSPDRERSPEDMEDVIFQANLIEGSDDLDEDAPEEDRIVEQLERLRRRRLLDHDKRLRKRIFELVGWRRVISTTIIRIIQMMSKTGQVYNKGTKKKIRTCKGRGMIGMKSAERSPKAAMRWMVTAQQGPKVLSMRKVSNLSASKKLSLTQCSISTPATKSHDEQTSGMCV